MTRTRNLLWSDCQTYARDVAKNIMNLFNMRRAITLRLYGVPRGGIFAAQLVHHELTKMVGQGVTVSLQEDPICSDYIIDDIVDSGRTRDSLQSLEKPFFALYDKIEKRDTDWIVFPWERMSKESGPEENVARIIEYFGEDPKREGLKETPRRVVLAYEHLLGGYAKKVESIFKAFEDGTCDEMVISKNIEFYSMCEHHMLPFFGKAHIAYIPNGKIIGLSKLARILDIFSRRLQVQERLTTEITAALDEHLKPKGSACIIDAKHLCCMSRGVGKQHSSMMTSSLTGVFRESSIVRGELLSLIAMSSL
jgi:GTP cyclohydrolase I